MRSSSLFAFAPGMRAARAAAAVLALSACASQPGADAAGADDRGPAACVRSGIAPGPQASAAVASLLRRAESAPLFDAAIAASPVAACAVAGADASLVATYTAANGNAYRLQRDEHIEYSDEEARFAVPPRTAPLNLLQDAERAAFAPAGCGIDWSHPEASPAAAASGSAVTVYRGDVCNCQARLHRSSAGVVVALGLRSAC
jgi:hypothetical protein